MTGEIVALVTAFLWAWTATFFSQAAKEIGSLNVNIYRLPMGLILLVITHLILFGTFTFTPYQGITLALSGVVGLAIGDAFLFEAFTLIGPRITMLIYTLSPPMTAILAFFFLGERLHLKAIAGMVIILLGIIFVLMEKREAATRLSFLGLFFAFMGSLGQAGGLILAKAALDTGIAPLPATILRMAAATAVLFIIGPFLKPLNPVKLLKKPTPTLLFLLGGVICGPFLGVWFSQVAIALTKTGIAATLMATVPIMIIPVAAIVEKEKITLRALIGAAVAVLGIALFFSG